MNLTEPFTVTEKAMRPASTYRRCFYCHRGIGQPHKMTCVLVKTTSRVRLLAKDAKDEVALEYTHDHPAHWSEHDLEFHQNESSWCIDNMIDDVEDRMTKARLLRMSRRNGCLCNCAEITVIEMGKESELDE